VNLESLSDWRFLNAAGVDAFRDSLEGLLELRRGDELRVWLRGFWISYLLISFRTVGLLVVFSF
jgi:hypothetical protein